MQTFKKHFSIWGCLVFLAGLSMLLVALFGGRSQCAFRYNGSDITQTYAFDFYIMEEDSLFEVDKAEMTAVFSDGTITPVMTIRGGGSHEIVRYDDVEVVEMRLENVRYENGALLTAAVLCMVYGLGRIAILLFNGYMEGDA